MVFAAQYTSCSALRFDDGICSMAANIMKAIDVAVTVLDKEKRQSSDFEGMIVSRFGKTQRVSDEKPSFVKNGTLFKLVQFRRAVP